MVTNITKFCLMAILVFLLSACGEITINGNGSYTVEQASGNLVPNAVEILMITGINLLRKQGISCQGKAFAPVGALDWNIALSGAAKTHVRDLLERQKRHEFDLSNITPPHLGSDGKRVDDRVSAQGYTFNMVAENLASVATGSASIDTVIESWKVSHLGHCEAMMMGSLKEVGVYFEDGVWAAVFAEPK